MHMATYIDSNIYNLYSCRYRCKYIYSSSINDSVMQCGADNLTALLLAVSCSVLQCVAVCCSVLQCVAICCNVLQCVAVCCSVLQCV